MEKSWKKLTVTALVSHFSLFAVLLVALGAIGVSDDQVGWAEVLAVFAFVRLLTAVPLTPGGIGFVELGLIGGLTSAGGDREAVVAAVLVYRLLTYVLPIFVGTRTYLFWRRNTSWRRGPAESTATVAGAGAGQPQTALAAG
ncbi:MAG: lysylphosphatidylglycerol synthase transmembrane domain-containing protein [Acidimicrobiales bacterium]